MRYIFYFFSLFLLLCLPAQAQEQSLTDAAKKTGLPNQIFPNGGLPNGGMEAMLKAQKGANAPDSKANLIKEIKEDDNYHNLVSLMLSKEEQEIAERITKFYDNPNLKYESEVVEEKKDDELVAADKVLKEQEKAEKPFVPNVYLGSIIYQSPAAWLVSINARAITNINNSPDNEFYITRISRKAVEVIWHPKYFNLVQQDWDSIWGNTTEDNPKKPDPHITLDNNNSLVVLELKPNQTFVVDEAKIREGLVVKHKDPVDVKTSDDKVATITAGINKMFNDTSLMPKPNSR